MAVGNRTRPRRAWEESLIPVHALYSHHQHGNEPLLHSAQVWHKQGSQSVCDPVLHCGQKPAGSVSPYYTARLPPQMQRPVYEPGAQGSPSSAMRCRERQCGTALGTGRERLRGMRHLGVGRLQVPARLHAAGGTFHARAELPVSIRDFLSLEFLPFCDGF